ncbi:type II toxin-antitoxin system RelE/ParE family toxin [Aidingimonas lacisalsi]|uniref:type II toxin-antitoxin system RelE/ParE family toxin n=1 Tax=Aidingimonas lacisalsi TaxID=2604086 RepID=UPI0011D19F9A|nr:type II toxin-antitoxin system RelE/ParE family toxin [Aidingimonas lacisalsi]
MKIEILEEAEQDLLAGFRFYDRLEPGLGQYFIDALFSDIDSLLLYAGVHQQVFGYYRLLAKRFPFSVYYRYEQDTVRVYAVLDNRQSPSQAVKRLFES